MVEEPTLGCSVGVADPTYGCPVWMAVEPTLWGALRELRWKRTPNIEKKNPPGSPKNTRISVFRWRDDGIRSFATTGVLILWKK